MRAYVPFVVVSTVLAAFALCALRPAAGAAPLPTEIAATPSPALRGLWSRYPDSDEREHAPVAFYYFHDGDIGLYRYGKVGYNATNSYRWSVAGDELILRWVRSGETSRTRFRVEQGPRPILVLDDDPKNPGQGPSRYVYVPPPRRAESAPDLFAAAEPGLPGLSAMGPHAVERIDDRVWLDQRTFSTGGMGFSMYQLRAAGIDGRGTGWHHVGDSADWSTEQLTYRATPGRLELLFPLRGERATTAITTTTRQVDGRPVRVLRLAEDPRDFWARHDYVDAGPSFAALAFGSPR